MSALRRRWTPIRSKRRPGSLLIGPLAPPVGAFHPQQAGTTPGDDGGGMSLAMPLGGDGSSGVQPRAQELTHPGVSASFSGALRREVLGALLKGGTMKELYELKGEGHSIRGIARELGISRNSVRKYLKSPGVPQAKPR